MSKFKLELSTYDLMKIKYALENTLTDGIYDEQYRDEHIDLLKRVNEYLGEE